ncbi:ankyrin repeat domain-containing protein [Flavobacterium silvisoli]|uniref:Ankyrin repeat domain-containing protein n=1 Tax=Flavobacterium silvisoli TaxID=2529433 RepID=A0A4Q9YYW8_9FLAO|nr:ankyrin repeat domain-containing protein [Flavobacterium silvisoli]TBX69133.1 ankyrin repeat domain-containing protein [Flavobacterium silvisoli]
MKKTIIFAGLALVAFANVSLASTVSNNAISKEVVMSTNSPLCTAIYKGDLNTVKKFIEYGADVNEESNGMTPLMFAARYNKVEIIKYLLEKGAKKDVKDERGYTALKYAEFSNSTDAIAILKQA